MEYNFYGLSEEYHEEQTDVLNASSRTSFIVALSIVGSVLFGGLSYYVYRTRNPKRPKFEQM